MFNLTKSPKNSVKSGRLSNGLISLSFASSLFFVGQAQAVFQPGQGPRPHTLCLQTGIADGIVTVPNAEALLQVAVTSLAPKTSGDAPAAKIDVSKKQSQTKVALASRNSQLAASSNEDRYLGEGLELTIQTSEADDLGRRPGHLHVQLSDGTSVDQDVQCQALLYPMSASGL